MNTKYILLLSLAASLCQATDMSRSQQKQPTEFEQALAAQNKQDAERQAQYTDAQKMALSKMHEGVKIESFNDYRSHWFRSEGLYYKLYKADLNLNGFCLNQLASVLPKCTTDDVELLLRRGLSPNRISDTQPLFFGVCHDQKKFKLFLAHGANVNAQDKTGRSLLHVLCAQAEHVDVVPALLTAFNAGCDMQHVDYNGMSPLMVLAKDGINASTNIKNLAQLCTLMAGMGVATTSTQRIHECCNVKELVTRGRQVRGTPYYFPDTLVTAIEDSATAFNTMETTFVARMQEAAPELPAAICRLVRAYNGRPAQCVIDELARRKREQEQERKKQAEKTLNQFRVPRGAWSRRG